jgi:hypothetical protein
VQGSEKDLRIKRISYRQFRYVMLTEKIETKTAGHRRKILVEACGIELKMKINSSC